MLDLIKRLKLSYAVYNFFQRERLKYNVPLYRKLGLNKRYYSPISSKDFKGLDGNLLYNHFNNSLDNINEKYRSSLSDFEKNGYAVLKNYLSEKEVTEINDEVERLIHEKRVSFKYKNKIMFAHHQSTLLSSLGENQQIKNILSYLLKNESVLFQSINFINGSEQATHSDSIHMTTFPFGGLIAIWIALDDITDKNGPLHYYPGSHKLPYYLNEDYNNCGNRFLIGKKDYTEYEKFIADKIKEKGLTKEIFYAKKGDVLIWHSNLFHGGETHTDKSKTRRSMVFHYYSKNVICYHEITQRPALLLKTN